MFGHIHCKTALIFFVGFFLLCVSSKSIADSFIYHQSASFHYGKAYYSNEKPAIDSTVQFNRTSHSMKANQLLAGCLAGTALAVAGGYLGIYLDTAPGPYDDMPHLGAVLIGGSAGLIIGSTLGVYLVGRKFGANGTLFATMNGCILGYVVGSGITLLTGFGAWPFFFISPSAGALVGYLMSNNSHSNQALLDLKNKQLSFGIPFPRVAWNNASMGITYNVRLVKILF